MVDILSRLPVKTIIHCKCVCKKWLNIVLESYFADLQLSRSPAGFMIHPNMERQMISYSKPGILKWVVIKEHLDHNRLYQDPIMSFHLNLSPIFQNSCVYHVGSANGLICLRQYDIKNNNYFICNPITREYIILPTQQYYKEGYVVINHEFGIGSLTNEYKLIRVLRDAPHNPSSEPEAEVYTLGTGQWRRLDHVPYWVGGCNGSFVNGHAHRYVFGKYSLEEEIYAFDFDSETFKLLPSPPVETPQGSRFHVRTLGVLKGCLCQCDSFGSQCTIWVMKEYGIKKSWHRELVIKRSINIDLGLLIVHRIEGLKDGTILIKSDRELLAYCPRRKTIVDTDLSDCCLTGLAYHPSFHRLHNFKNERIHVF